MKKGFWHIYGPVFSWRLGRSLGIDILPVKRKICTYDCVYCQIGNKHSSRARRKIYTPTRTIAAEIRRLPEINIDYITFSGSGEPTLAKNLGEAIKEVRKLRREPIAILTNSSLIHRKDVMRELKLADFVIAKLDASSQRSFDLINRPIDAIKFRDVLYGIRKFRKCYSGKFAIQIMFVAENKDEADKLARLLRTIKPDEVQINTPLRPSGAKPLSQKELRIIKSKFTGLKVLSVYDINPSEVIPMSAKDVMMRRRK